MKGNKRKRHPGRTGVGQRGEWQLNEQREEIIIEVEEREENIDIEERERARAGIEPTAAASSQPDCPGISRSDHSAG